MANWRNLDLPLPEPCPPPRDRQLREAHLHLHLQFSLGLERTLILVALLYRETRCLEFWVFWGKVNKTLFNAQFWYCQRRAGWLCLRLTYRMGRLHSDRKSLVFTELSAATQGGMALQIASEMAWENLGWNHSSMLTSGLFLSLLLRLREWEYGRLACCGTRTLGLGVRQPLTMMCTQKQSLGRQAVTQPAKD